MVRTLRIVNAVIKDGDGLVDYFKGDEVAGKHVAELEKLGALEPLEGDEPTESKDQPTAPGPAGGTGAPITGDYESHPATDLQAEATRRGVTVEGTGAGGNVLKGDLVKALEADDAAKASS